MKACSVLNLSLDSIHKGEDHDGILSTTEEPETNVADSFDGSGVVAAAVSSAIPQSVINYWTNLNAKGSLTDKNQPFPTHNHTVRLVSQNQTVMSAVTASVTVWLCESIPPCV